MHHHIKEGYKRGMKPSEFRRQFLDLKGTHVFSFDDGLKEHYTIAFPLLREHGVVGYFFPIAETLAGKFSHVHKGHILLDRYEEELITMWNRHSEAKFVPKNEPDKGKYRFDSLTISQFKIYLASVGVGTKNMVFDAILEDVGISLNTEEYYMTISELEEMSEAGMVVGNHTFTHPHLSHLSPHEQECEILGAHEMIKYATGETPFAFSYPFGSYDANTTHILKKFGYRVGLTTNSPLEMGRLDCKDVKT